MINLLIKYIDEKRRLNNKKIYDKWLESFILFFFAKSFDRFIEKSFEELKQRIGPPVYCLDEAVSIFYSGEECFGVITGITLYRDEEAYHYLVEFKYQNQIYRLTQTGNTIISHRYRNRTINASFKELLDSLKEKTFYN